ncbi:MAG: Holliday junction branch migration protein RuvA [Halofilum sp. (in: g-proteobacteria)]
MIGRLTGILTEKQPPGLLVDVGGVGYELEAPLSTFYDLPETGAQVSLFTHLVVREDAHLLYGFAREAERRLFRVLLKVSGVGPRMALAILSGMTADEFARSVESDDTTALTRLPGIGKKTAQRLIVEMRDRLEQGDFAGALAPGASAPESASEGDSIADATSALVALGYRPAEASRMVRPFASAGSSTEDLIRSALQAAAQ